MIQSFRAQIIRIIESLSYEYMFKSVTSRQFKVYFAFYALVYRLS